MPFEVQVEQLLTSLIRHWSFRRFWSCARSWWTCVSHHRIWLDRYHALLYGSRLGRTRCCISCRRIFRRLRQSIPRSRLGLRYGLEVRLYTYCSFLDLWVLIISSYALSWLVTLPLEIVAASITMSFWEGARSVNPAAWVTLFLFLIISINLFGVKGYGEAEFVFSIIKVIAVIGFIILGIIIDTGGVPGQPYMGAKYW